MVEEDQRSMEVKVGDRARAGKDRERGERGARGGVELGWWRKGPWSRVRGKVMGVSQGTIAVSRLGVGR